MASLHSPERQVANQAKRHVQAAVQAAKALSCGTAKKGMRQRSRVVPMSVRVRDAIIC